MNFWEWLLLAAVLLAVLWLLWCCVLIVEKNTIQVIARWGDHHRLAYPGLNWRWILAEKVRRVFSGQRRVVRLSLQGAAGGKLPLDIDIQLTVVDCLEPHRIVQLAYEFDNPEAFLEQRLAAVVRELLLPMDSETVMAGADGLGRRILAGISEVAEECGQTILDLRITKLVIEPSVAKARIESIRAAEVRRQEEAEAAHRNSLLAARATAEAEANKITATAADDRLGAGAIKVRSVLGALQASGLSDASATSIVAAMVYQQTAMGLAANPGAQIYLPAPGIKLEAGVPYNLSEDPATPSTTRA